MNRKIIYICGILCMLFSLAACQKTPDKAVVVDKSQGLPEDSVLPGDSETPKDLGVPKHWKESVEKGKVSVSIEADCRIDLPEIYNTPVYELEMRHMNKELLEQLCEYFADGDGLYKEPSMTKARLEQERIYLQEGKGEWGFDDSEIIEAKIENLDQLLEAAPEKAVHDTVKLILEKPHQTEYEWIQQASGSIPGRYSKFYFDTDEEIGFRARIDRFAGADPLIYVIDYNKDVGSTTNFLFRQGNFVDENKLEKNLKFCEYLDMEKGYQEYLEWIKTEMNRTDSFRMSQEEAVEMSEKILKDLELEEYVMTDCCRAVGNENSESMAGVNQEEGITDYGFSIYYSRKAGELPGYEQPVQQPFNDLPEKVYAPPFAAEQIRMIATDRGIMAFEWNNLSESKETIAENTRLLSFDEMKEKLYEHLLYVTLAKYGEKDYGDIYTYQIKDVKLKSANVPAYENPAGAWMVPVWVLEVAHEITYKNLGTYSYGDMIVVLNAIDGGYIQPNIDPRISVD